MFIPKTIEAYPQIIRNAEIQVPTDIQSRYGDYVEILNNDVITSNGSSEPINVADYSEARLFVIISSVSGVTPSLNVKIQSQEPVSLTWVDIANMSPITTTGAYTIPLSNMGLVIRIAWTVGGTSPSFTATMSLVRKV